MDDSEHAPGMEDMAGGANETERPITEEKTPEDDGETIRVPEAFLQGTRFKAGDELVLKVVSVDEDGLEVAYAKGAEGGEEGEDKSSRASANDELDALDKESDY